jgi:hypothetical protein
MYVRHAAIVLAACLHPLCSSHYGGGYFSFAIASQHTRLKSYVRQSAVSPLNLCTNLSENVLF